ncbi:MAG: ATP-binding protein [Thermodesulfobacteriota bacterium]|nr:ATP-binding protein [Thermodesulfobacteriota bacterium]
MNFFRFQLHTIKNKLTLMMMLTASVGLVLASITISAYDLYSYKKNMKDELVVLANVLGNSVAEDLLFGDFPAARKTLEALRAKKNIVAARIYRDGAIFASYQRRAGEKLDFDVNLESADHYRFEKKHLCLLQTISVADKYLARIVIKSDLQEIDVWARTFAVIVFTIFTLAAFVAYLFSAVMQRMISEPILSLVKTARRIAEKKDYSVRAEKQTEDELGELTDAFNGMLEEIGARERALEVAKENLEERVEQRTAELQKTNEDLQLAKEMADGASRTKGAFLATMSHEIRTPLNGVIAAADLAMSAENVSPLIQRYLEIINNSADSLLHILDDILDSSKIEAGKLVLENRPFSLTGILDSLVNVFSAKALAQQNELLFDIDPAVPPLLVGDSMRLQQVMANLVDNAIKFTKKGTVQVGVQCAKKTEDRVDLHFSVKDSGAGINSESLDCLFEPFQQADGSSTRKYGGTGLGLTISRQLVQMLGGRIRVKSTPGKGSLFYFSVTLPWSGSESEEAGLSPELEGLRVLVVDDNPVCREIINKMLSLPGCRVETVESGHEALNRISERKGQSDSVELVLLDWRMPDGDGVAAAAEIRSRIQPDLPILMMSAFGVQREITSAEKQNANGFLSKPILRGSLIAAINGLFAGEGRQGEQPVFPETAPGWERVAESSCLPGIDVQEVLARLGIDQETFNHVLASFFRDFTDFVVTINDAFAGKNIEAIQKLAHKIKGSSGTIGANKLFRAAEQVDMICKKGDLPDREQILAVETALNEVLHSISGIIDLSAPESSDVSLKVVDIVNLDFVISQLGEALDHALLENINESLRVLKEHVVGMRVEKLQRLIAVYQYDEAREILEDISAKIKTGST